MPKTRMHILNIEHCPQSTDFCFSLSKAVLSSPCLLYITLALTANNSAAKETRSLQGLETPRTAIRLGMPCSKTYQKHEPRSRFFSNERTCLSMLPHASRSYDWVRKKVGGFGHRCGFAQSFGARLPQRSRLAEPLAVSRSWCSANAPLIKTERCGM